MKAVKDSIIYLVGELTSKSVPFLLLPYLSRKLGVEGYGELSYYQTFLALFVILVSLSQEGAVARYFYFYGKRTLNLIVNSGYLYTLIVGTIIFIFCWITKSEILAYLAISAIFQTFLSVQLAIRQCQKQAISYTLIQLIWAIISAVITVLFLEYFQQGLVEKRILAILSSNILVFLIAYFLYRNKTKKIKGFRLDKYKLGILYILAFGLPLLLHHSSLFLKGQLDRIFIYHQFSQYDLGLYAMGAQLAAIFMIAIQAINKATIPYLFEGIKTGKIKKQHIFKWTLYSFLIVPIPPLIALLIPESIITLVLGEKFIGTKYYFILFLLSTTLTIPYLILVNYLFYYGRNKIISLCSILSTFFYIIALIMLTQTENINLVPYASIIGAILIIPILFYRVYKEK